MYTRLIFQSDAFYEEAETHRGRDNDRQCKLCGDKRESVVHVLWECPVTYGVPFVPKYSIISDIKKMLDLASPEADLVNPEAYLLNLPLDLLNLPLNLLNLPLDLLNLPLDLLNLPLDLLNRPLNLLNRLLDLLNRPLDLLNTAFFNVYHILAQTAPHKKDEPTLH